MRRTTDLRKNEPRHRVVVVHGLAANNSATWLLGRRLRQQGFDTRLFGYRSIRPRVEDHAERLASFLKRRFADDPASPLHLVVHSMGGIITRVMFSIPLVVISGSLIIETYFGIPGVGKITYDAITSGDQPVLKAVVGLTAVMFVITLMLTDILYRVVDPRVALK